MRPVVLDPPVRKLMCLAALVVSCATVDEIRLPWMQEPDAAEQARDDQEEQRRIEQRLKAIERETAPRVAPSPPPPPPPPPAAADPFADDEAVLATERAAVLEPDQVEEDVELTDDPPPAKAKKSKKARPAVVTRTKPPRPPPEPPPMRVCCKYCDRGKPCGDTCIAANKTCRVGRGCAC